MAETLYRYGIKLKSKGNHNLQFRKPKLELGTVATDWSPAPEDPDEDLYEKFTILQTDFSVIQGEIQAKVWETDIEKATDGLYESINEMYSYINESVNNITAQVGNLTYIVDENYTTLLSQISDLTLTDNSITAMVEDVAQTVIDNYAETTSLIAQLQLTSQSIEATVANMQTYATGWNYLKDTDDPYNAMRISGDVGDYGWFLNYGSATKLTGSGVWAGFEGQVIPESMIGIYANTADYINRSVSQRMGFLVNGRTYTLSWYARSSDSMAMIVNLNYESGETYRYANGIIINDSDGWKRYTYTWTHDTDDDIVITFGTNGARIGGIYFAAMKVENGNTATEWTPDSSYTYSQIKLTENSIALTVSSSTNGSASIIMTVDGEESGGTLYANGLRNAFANDTSAIAISAGTITFNSNTFIVNSSYFSVTADGHITATAGTIGGWTIGSNALYSGVTDITDMNTTGVMLASGNSGGLRINYNSLGMLLRYARLEFQHTNMQKTTAYVAGSSYYATTGVWGLRVAGLGLIAMYAPWLLIGSDYVEPGSSGTGYIGFTGSYAFLTSTAGTTRTMYFQNGICYG